MHICVVLESFKIVIRTSCFLSDTRERVYEISKHGETLTFLHSCSWLSDISERPQLWVSKKIHNSNWICFKFLKFRLSSTQLRN